MDQTNTTTDMTDVPLVEGGTDNFDALIESGDVGTPTGGLAAALAELDAESAAAKPPAAKGQRDAAGRFAATADADDDQGDDETTAAQDATVAAESDDDQGDTTDDDATPVVAAAVPTVFAERFPDLAGRDLTGVVEAFARERETNDSVIATATEYPAVGTLLKRIETARASGQAIDLQVLAAEIIGVPDVLPDADDDPDAYAAALRAQGRREAEAAQAKAEASRQQQQAEQYERDASASVQALASEEGWDEGTTRRWETAMAEFITAPPKTFAKTLYRALNHDAIVAREVEKARADERTKTTRELRRGGAAASGAGDGIARFSEGRAAPAATSDLDTLTRQLGTRSEFPGFD